MDNQIIHIEQCGFLTTIQDSGRKGFLQYGVSKGGAMDGYAAQVANVLVGNEFHNVVFEITQAPHRFRFLKDALIAFTGGGLQPYLNENTIPLNQPFFVHAGSVIEMNQQIPGFRLYMAIAGSIAADLFLNSYSTSLLVQAGGFEGRTLKKEDVLSSKHVATDFQKKLIQVLKTGAAIKIHHEILNLQSAIIRVQKGVEWNFLTTEAHQKISTATFTIGQQSNRMGYRLKGEGLQTNQPCEIISSAVTQGTVQLTPSGELILLMAEAQTVGGYPRIMQVCAADLSILAQKKPGDEIQFQMVSLQEAEDLYVAQNNKLNKLQESLLKLYAH